MEFPLGLFGVAIGTVILPHLSRRHAATDAQGYNAALDWGLRLALLIGMPAGLGLILLAEPVTASVYHYGKFNAFDTQMAAISLGAMSVGIPAFMLSKVLSPAFFARQDARTPMRAALATVAANVLLTIALTTPLWLYQVRGAHVGIALATALAGIFNAWLLWRALRRQGLHRPEPGWGRFLWQTVAACMAMAAVVLVLRGWVGDWNALGGFWLRAAWLLLVIAAGGLAYVLALFSGLRRVRAPLSAGARHTECVFPQASGRQRGLPHECPWHAVLESKAAFFPQGSVVLHRRFDGCTAIRRWCGMRSHVPACSACRWLR